MQSVLLQKSYSLDEFARLNDIALTTVRGEIRSGRLVARCGCTFGRRLRQSFASSGVNDRSTADLALEKLQGAGND
jgi:hypothetical protein